MKRTYQPDKHKRTVTCGFFARKAAGTKVVKNRRAKGRKSLTA